MKSTVLHTALLATILVGTSAMIGCSSFNLSGSSDYVGPDGLSRDVSNLPNPNAPPSEPKNASPQYGRGRRAPESPEKLLFQANAFYEQKRYHDSERLYKKYLATPESQTAPADVLATIHYRLGCVARKKMFLPDAESEYKTACQFAPQNNDYLFSYAKVSYEAGDYKEADQGFVTLLNRNPDYPEAQRYYGLTLLESSNRTNALQPLTASVGELEANALLTDKYYESGELEQAFQSEKQTIQIAARLGRQIPSFPHKNKALGNQSASLTAAQTTVQSYGFQSVAPSESVPFVGNFGMGNVDSYAQSTAFSSNATIPFETSLVCAPATENAGAATSSAAFANGVNQTSNNDSFVPTTESSDSVAAIVPTTENGNSAAAIVPTTESVSELSAVAYPSLAPAGSVVSADQTAETSGSPVVANNSNVATAFPDSLQTASTRMEPYAQDRQYATPNYSVAPNDPNGQGYANSGQFADYAPQFPGMDQFQAPYQPIPGETRGSVETSNAPFGGVPSANVPKEDGFAFATSGSGSDSVARVSTTNAPAYVAAVPNGTVPQYAAPYAQNPVPQPSIPGSLPENSFFKID